MLSASGAQIGERLFGSFVSLGADKGLHGTSTTSVLSATSAQIAESFAGSLIIVGANSALHKITLSSSFVSDCTADVGQTLMGALILVVADRESTLTWSGTSQLCIRQCVAYATFGVLHEGHGNSSAGFKFVRTYQLVL